MSQMELAAAASFTTAYVSRLERGLRSPSLDTIAEFAVALGTIASDLLDETERGMSAPDPIEEADG